MKMPVNRMLRQKGRGHATDLAIHGIPLTSAEVGTPYTFSGYATGGQGPYVFTLVGSWPAGAAVEGDGADFTVTWEEPGADRELVFVNPGFETGDNTGWTTTTGTTQPLMSAGGMDYGPRTGSWMMWAGNYDATNGNSFYQDFAILTEEEAAVDAGGCMLKALAAWHQTIAVQGDNGSLKLWFYDEDGMLLDVNAVNGPTSQFGDGWHQRAMPDTAVPVGTRTIRMGTDNGIGIGPSIQSFWDDFSNATLAGVGGTYTGLSVRVTDAMGDTADLATFTITVYPPGEAPAGGDYPLGVVALSLQTTWDRRPGNTGAMTKTLPANTPAGSGYYAPANWLLGAPFSETNFDFDGYGAYLNGGDFSASNFRLRHNVSAQPNNSILLGVGHVNGGGAAANVALTDGVVDQISTCPGVMSVVVDQGSSLSCTRVSFKNTNNRSIFTAGNITIAQCYFEGFGQVSGGGHTENLFLRNGVHVITFTFFDPRSAPLPPVGEQTAPIFLAPDDASYTTNATIEDSIILVTTAGGKYNKAIEVGGVAGSHCHLRLRRVAIQKGLSDYVSRSADPACILTWDIADVVDLDTGEDIVAHIIAAIS